MCMDAAPIPTLGEVLDRIAACFDVPRDGLLTLTLAEIVMLHGTAETTERLRRWNALRATPEEDR